MLRKNRLGALSALLLIFTSVGVGAVLTEPTDLPSTSEWHVYAVEKGPFEQQIELLGTVTPKSEMSIYSPLSSRITQLTVRAGTRVAAGDTVGWLRPYAAPEKLLAAQQDSARAQIRNDAAQLAMRRLQTLADSGLAAQQDLEQAVTGARIASVDLVFSELRLERLRESTTYPLTSPGEGMVLKVELREGEVALPPEQGIRAEPILILASGGGMVFSAQADEVQLADLRVGLPASVELAGMTRASTGVISHIGPLAEPATSGRLVFKVEIDLEDSGALRVGYSGRANVRIHSFEDVLLVPARAIRWLDGTAVVSVVGPQSAVSDRSVEVGAINGTHAVVVFGLSEGEKVLAAPTPRAP